MVQSKLNRQQVIEQAADLFRCGNFKQTLARRVAYRTVSQEPQNLNILFQYLSDEIGPLLSRLGFSWSIIQNPLAEQPPLIIAERIDDPDALTVLLYGHGDVTQGQDELWSDGLNPWELCRQGDRLYGRGSADNKGQHSINFAALETVLNAREGRLGYNIKLIFEMGEETGSPGLAEVCQQHAEFLSADLFLASDGPRIRHDLPTLFLGSRGVCQFKLSVDSGNGGRHSGNWGGIITNPAIVLTHAIDSLISARGQLKVDFLRPPAISDDVSELIRDLPVGGEEFDPTLNPQWGEPGLSIAEQLYGFNTLEVVGLGAGRVDKPVGAIPGRAEAICQLRFVRGTDWSSIEQKLREHLDQQGLKTVQVTDVKGYDATRLDPDHPWVQFAKHSLEQSLGQTVALLPNLGGTIPNYCFADILKLPTVWLPHSYPSCNQHAPDEHLLSMIVEQGLKAAAGLFWDLASWPSEGL